MSKRKATIGKSRGCCGAAPLLGHPRCGFEFITNAQEVERIQVEMRRLRVTRDSSRLGLSECESDFLYAHNRIGGCYLQKAQFAQDGSMYASCLLWLATIIQHMDNLLTRLCHTLCIWWIHCLRLWQQSKSFWHYLSYKYACGPNLKQCIRRALGGQACKCS